MQPFEDFEWFGFVKKEMSGIHGNTDRIALYCRKLSVLITLCNENQLDSMKIEYMQVCMILEKQIIKTKKGSKTSLFDQIKVHRSN